MLQQGKSEVTLLIYQWDTVGKMLLQWCMKTCFLNFARDQSAAVLNQKMLNRTWHSETFTRNEMARVVRHSQRLSKKLKLRIWSKVGHKTISWLWLPDWLRLLRTIPSEKVCLNMTIRRWMSPRIGLYGSPVSKLVTCQKTVMYYFCMGHQTRKIK